jgi:Kelch motif protein
LKLLAFAGMWMMLAPFAVDALAQGSWTMKARTPLARNEVALAAVGGEVHVIGGRFGASPDKTDIYDSATNSWTSGPPLPTTRSGLAYTVYRKLRSRTGW